MEYVEGKSLDQLIPKKGLRLNQVLSWSIQIASALATAHRAGIIHRDLKPSNVLVSDTGTVKLLDFGVAKLATKSDETLTLSAQDQTQDGVVLGTVSYMSPEQAEGRDLDERSDIFSFGSVLYEMATGQKAFRGESALSTLNAIMRDNPKPAVDLGIDLPSDLQKLIDRCMRKDPARRVQHMDDVKLALEELKEESESGRTTSNVAGVGPVRKPETTRRLTLGAIAVAVVLAGIAGYQVLDGPAETPAAPIRAVPLTTYAGSERTPSFSPDGNQIVFSWNGDAQENYDIYVKLIDAGTPLRLTTDPASDSSPVWSPDGRLIAFLRQRPNRSAVIVIPPLGGPERTIGEISPGSDWPFDGARLSWSPDSKQLVIMDREVETEPTGLFVLSAETREKRRLTKPVGNSLGDGYPSVSPDGRSLAFIRSPTYVVGDLYLMPLAQDLKPAGEPMRLTSDNRRIHTPVWTPDGRQIIFPSNRNDSLSLWRISPQTRGKPEHISSIGQGAVALALVRRPAGGTLRMAYADSNAVGRDIHQLSLSDPSSKAGSSVKIVASTRDENSPVYSPDGRKIAFGSAASGSYEIWVSESNGANAVQLTSFGGPISDHPAWSPDGKSIVFHSRPEGQAEIYVIGSDGGQPRRLTHEPAEDVLPSWSHDGAWIYFGSRRSGENQIWKIPAVGGPAVQVTKNGGLAVFESPDGRFLYYTKQRGVTSLWKRPVTGGPEIQVVNSLFYLGFAVAKTGVYLVQEGVSSLAFLSFDDGPLKKIAAVSRVSNLAVSPNGQYIAYTQPQPGGQDLMLVDNFR